MKRFIDLVPVCDECEGELALLGIQIDMPNCAYILHLECVVCGADSYFILALEDFIEINQSLYPPGCGGRNYENPNNN